MPTEFPISDTINVNISRETLFPTSDGFGTLLIAGASAGSPGIGQRERVRFYTSLDDVEDDFAGDEEAVAAAAAFSQEPKPARIGIGRILNSSPKAYMRTDILVAPSVFAAVSDGTFTISIDGDEQDITGVDFTGDITLADVVATLQVVLRAIGSGGYTACTVTTNSPDFTRMWITSGTNGSGSSVSALTPEGTGTDISGPGFMNGLANVAFINEAYDYVSFTDELNRIEDANDDWYSFALTRDQSSVQHYLDAAAWAEPRLKILAAFDNSLAAFDPQATSDLGFQLKAAGYNRTFVHWNQDSAAYPEVSTLARLATVDYEVPQSALTLKFQKLPGITPLSLNTTQRGALLDKNYEIYTLRGGVNMLEEGKMASGEFIDIMHGVDWLADTIAIRVFGELYVESNKVAMTDVGVARLESKVKEVLDTGTEANIIATDYDDEGNLVPAFTITTVAVLDYPQALRAAREGPPISFVGRLSGAIHSQTVTGVVTV